ncbi:MAG: putative membrane protein YphA (DoxX/SURF4 family) [Maribacter sp.]|jgi:uncharacterized membrane protein YphA (DoxX/SURF4 family)
MTLAGLLIRIAITAVGLTLLNLVIKKMKPEWAEIENWGMTYLQNFCGALFIFSGYVKAIDPKGTAYKMEQYFGEFETHFFDFLLPLWEICTEYALAISLLMVVFEIVLGLMLVLGYKRKLTAWLFLGLIIPFTFLTGFTYLTGYVPEGVNFFSFGGWGEYVTTNMKVTDCGCFGDYIKLEPKVSFFKDLALLVPSFLFLFFYTKKHVIFTPKIRNIILGVSTVIVSAFCYINTFSGLPMQDFRPFKNGTDVRAVRAAEEIGGITEILAYVMKNKTTEEEVEVPYAEFMGNFAKYAEKYPKEEWDYDTKQTEPKVKPTKISEFFISDDQGSSGAENKIIDHEGYHLMAVAYQWKYDENREEMIQKDSIFAIDTIAVEGIKDSFQLQQRFVQVQETPIVKTNYDWDDSYAKKYSEKVNPLFEAAEKDGVWVYGITKPYSPEQIDEFRHHIQATYPFYTADDILLKTIIRSNPGVLLWKDGKIIKKWHIKHLPDYEGVKAYMK